MIGYPERLELRLRTSRALGNAPCIRLLTLGGTAPPAVHAAATAARACLARAAVFGSKGIALALGIELCRPARHLRPARLVPREADHRILLD